MRDAEEETALDCYEIWFDVKESHKDLQVCESIARYMGYLRDKGFPTA